MFTVDFIVTGQFAARVDADNPEKALRLAEQAICEADFGELKEIEWDIVLAQEE